MDNKGSFGFLLKCTPTFRWGAFVSIFSHVFGNEIIKGAMLLHRGIGFYLFVFICAIIVLVNTFRAKKEEKLEEKIDEKVEESK